MQVIFKARDADAEQFRTIAVRRVRFAMRRLSWLAPRASVQLSDVNGPRGGVDKRCQIELATKGGPPVIVTSMARDWLSALQSALTRATRSLLHSYKRSRQQRAPELKPSITT
jgi:hypothetical protein